LILVRYPEIKLKNLGGSNQWLLRYSTFDILRSSSIGGCLPLEVVFPWRLSSFQALLILVWSPELEFSEFILSQTHTDRHLSECSSSLAFAEIGILLRIENQSRFVRSGSY
jgi:hypothetical protein